ncbi:MAG: hypothetical protein A4E45_01701 [Methanosaeta sp. PtaB.Bin039]|nr:MAG: hypothetical protein A4E45_01701 [Methanosaeta sp. PtaB.Bin039]OPY47704.1 MAG: hypothetical protein A4E47_00154 [Methanosaeta sp. PtaU1.Bin028]HOT07856.1 hypothetical protein [Methanotrichaceae archaeon]HQF17567.1 hypothetical protein [Methanotrichaceae archaeon]HQI92139.1 hypothetical protein [Methanotrichaceae archaeon]
MDISRPIGFLLIMGGLLGMYVGSSIWNSVSPDDGEFVMVSVRLLFAVPIWIASMVVLGIAARAAKR